MGLPSLEISLKYMLWSWESDTENGDDYAVANFGEGPPSLISFISSVTPSVNDDLQNGPFL